MVLREMPALLMIASMFLLASKILVRGDFPTKWQSTVCPRTVVAIVDELTGTYTSDCQMSKIRGQLRARCDPYCGKQYPNAVYVSVVIGSSCTNVKRVAINTPSFADANSVRPSPPRLFGVCQGYRAFISQRFTIPGALCDNQPSPTDVSISLYDSCNNIVDDCAAVHMIQRTCDEQC